MDRDGRGTKRVCKYWKKGNCRKGYACDYGHQKEGSGAAGHGSPGGKKRQKTGNDVLGRLSGSRGGGGNPFRRLLSPFGEEICDHFQVHGTCKYGDSCTFSHDLPSPSSSSPFSQSSSLFGQSPFGGQSNKRKAEFPPLPDEQEKDEQGGEGTGGADKRNDHWDTKHVRLPCSARNVYKNPDNSKLLSKWYVFVILFSLSV